MAIWPSYAHEILLSSITSTELRKIIFLARPTHYLRLFVQRMEEWTLIDSQLCELVTRLGMAGHRHTLEVELRLVKIWGYAREYEFTKFLPRFREKGVVTITHAAHGADRVLHSSTYNR